MDTQQLPAILNEFGQLIPTLAPKELLTAKVRWETIMAFMKAPDPNHRGFETLLKGFVADSPTLQGHGYSVVLDEVFRFTPTAPEEELELPPLPDIHNEIVRIEELIQEALEKALGNA